MARKYQLQIIARSGAVAPVGTGHTNGNGEIEITLNRGAKLRWRDFDNGDYELFLAPEKEGRA